MGASIQQWLLRIGISALHTPNGIAIYTSICKVDTLNNTFKCIYDEFFANFAYPSSAGNVCH